MKHFIPQSVTNHALLQRKLSSLRMCVLITLVVTAAGLALSPPPEAPVAAQAQPLAGLTVALDPGHGGYDGGARAHDSGVWEKKLTLQIALTAEKELVAQGAQVVLTRREDLCLSDAEKGKARKRADLQARRDLAEAAGADVLISIHLNEYRSREESGPQVFYQRGGEEGRLLAGAMQEALIEVLQPAQKRSAIAGNYYVLRGKLPSVLVECGFLSNAQEERLLLDEGYHQRIAQALARGLALWAELKSRAL